MTQPTFRNFSARRQQRLAGLLPLLLLVSLVLTTLLPAAPAYAQEPAPPVAQATPWLLPDAAGVRVGWDANGALAATAATTGATPNALSADAVATALGGFPRQRYQGYDLPLRVISLRLPLGAPVNLEVRGVQAIDL
ncbi:MAG: hypothetical protein ACRC1H_03560, partial [Caldilineaceae bacterium]